PSRNSGSNFRRCSAMTQLPQQSQSPRYEGRDTEAVSRLAHVDGCGLGLFGEHLDDFGAVVVVAVEGAGRCERCTGDETAAAASPVIQSALAARRV
ncbi:hypothetical protein ACFRCW_32770, partial [Streptomyces sp. NPDC056653]|uniref:hypothetical protein n=1 Tax=Streptomyces sp. NPDC056653 TaxID=3345894 RepID=UPI0036CA28EC